VCYPTLSLNLARSFRRSSLTSSHPSSSRFRTHDDIITLSLSHALSPGLHCCGRSLSLSVSSLSFFHSREAGEPGGGGGGRAPPAGAGGGGKKRGGGGGGWGGGAAVPLAARAVGRRIKSGEARASGRAVQSSEAHGSHMYNNTINDVVISYFFCIV